MRGKKYTYTVKGTWPFPVDMLRYDLAEPATLEDAELIAELSRDCVTLERLQGAVVIQLQGRSPPTQGRWESFRWQVVL